MFTRRQLLTGLGASALLPAARVPPPDRRFLIVLTAFGGASLTDSVLAVSRSACAQAGGDPARRTTYADWPLAGLSGPAWAAVRPVPDSPFLAVSWKGTIEFGGPRAGTFDQGSFLRRHRDQILVMPYTATSVNHETGQYRAVTGDGAWRGRTLQEEVAAFHGEGDPIPNVLLSTGSGFVRPGSDATLDPRFRGELAPDPRRWPLSLDRAAGIPDVDRRALDRATALRGQIDPATPFSRTWGRTPVLERFHRLRDERRPALEAAGLAERLRLFDGGAGLRRAPEADALAARFPDLARDPQFLQAAVAFLLIKHRFASAVTLGPGSANVFLGDRDGDLELRQLTLGFDQSHTDHQAAQAFMWHRVFTLVDHLIALLSAEPFDDHRSLWDQTVIYVATEFGRQRRRPPDASVFSTGHDANNGALLISPRLRGNRVVGGVDPATLRTFGARPGSWSPDPAAELDASHVYATVLQALGVDTAGSGLPDMSGLIG